MIETSDSIPATATKIEINLSRLTQLFNSLDPSPFHERDLDHDAEDYIVGVSRGGFASAPTRSCDPPASRSVAGAGTARPTRFHPQLFRVSPRSREPPATAVVPGWPYRAFHRPELLILLRA